MQMYEKILNYKSQVTVTFISGGRTVLFERLMRFGVISNTLLIFVRVKKTDMDGNNNC